MKRSEKKVLLQLMKGPSDLQNLCLHCRLPRRVVESACAALVADGCIVFNGLRYNTTSLLQAAVVPENKTVEELRKNPPPRGIERLEDMD